jgi:hypothetical protein
MQNIKKTVDALSIDEKVDLFNYLYASIAGRGINGDTELAHVNKEEAALLKSVGGSGTVNPHTGLRQYFGGGSKPSAPSSQTVTQQATIPPEIAPYITDILGRAQAIQEKREAEGFVPYTGQQIAEFTPEQEQAFRGIQSLVGTSQQYMDPAARLTASAATTPTTESVGQFMSPYMQNVVDIQQREARRAGDVAQQQLAAGAVGAGGFGGSRQAILEAEQQRNLQQQLGDIQARGLASAYEDAQNRLAQQRARELSAGAQFAGLGGSAVQTGLQELGALQQVGGVRQAQTQSALDLARQQFEAERTYPEQLLQRYSSVIRGYQMDPNLMRSTMSFTPQPSYLQQFAGFGVGAGALGKAFGAFKTGGQIKKGLASIVVKRKKGGKVVGLQAGGNASSGDRLDNAIKEAEGVTGMGLGMIRAGVPSPAQQAQERDTLRRLSEESMQRKLEAAQLRQSLANRIGEVSPAERELLKYYQEERAMAPQRRQEIMAETAAEKEALNRAKYFELANVGFRFAEPQGGTGGVLSDLVRSLQPSVSEFGRISAAESGLLKQQRKELQALTDRERDMLAKEAGISREQLNRELQSEEMRIKVQEDTIDLDLELQKNMMALQRDYRKENLSAAQVASQYLNHLTDYAGKIANANKQKQPTSSDINTIRAMVASSYGYQLDKETGSISLGGKTLLSTDPKLSDMSRDEANAIKEFVAARAVGQDGFIAASKWVENRTKERLDRAVAADANRQPATDRTTTTSVDPNNPVGLNIRPKN